MRHMPLVPRLALYFSAFVIFISMLVPAFKHPEAFIGGAAGGAIVGEIRP